MDTLVAHAHIFSGNSSIHGLIRTHDWTTSPLGVPDTWPHALKAMYALMLDSKIPMSIVWGPRRVLLYNDSYIPFLGEKHPFQAFGLPIREVWPEIWDDIGPLIERAAAGDAFYIEDMPLGVHRNGREDAAWFTFSYSPVRDDSGALHGMCSSVMETTSRVLSEKRQALFVLLANALSKVTDAQGAMREAATMLGQHLKVSRVHFAELDFESDTVFFHDSYNDGTVPPLGEKQTMSGFGPHNIAYLAKRECVVINDVNNDPGTQDEAVRESFTRLGAAAIVAAPVTITNELVAVVGVNNRMTRYWQEQEIALIREVAEYTWSVVERLRAEQQLRQMAQTLEERVAIRTAELERAQARQGFQLQVADLLRGLSEPSAICSRISEMLGRHLRLSRVLFGEYDVEHGLVTYHSNYTHDASKELSGTYQVAKFGSANFTSLENRTTWISADLSRDPRTAGPETWPTYASLDIHAAVVVPLSRRGTVIDCLFINDNKPRHWTDDDISLIQDVAERTWNAIERVRAEEALKEADRRKDQFLAMLAHELRNPLAPISAAAQLLKIAGTDAGRVQRTSEVIARQVDHMTGLVDDLLDVSRVTRGLVTLDKAEVDVKRVIADAVEQVSPHIEARHHQLTVNLAPVPAVVLGDYKRLVQVLANLINNAAKYTPDGGHIQVWMESADECTVIRVSDNGIGMSADLLPHVFDLFSQAKRTPDRSQGGLGLGLALVKTLAELHGGSVSASSKGSGTGSEFVVKLPRPQREAHTHSVYLGSDARQQQAAQPMRVLVVDDNVDAAQMLAMYLEAAGYTVSAEFSPGRALERVSREAFDACLLDIGLPGMDGNELARHLRAAPTTRDAILIAITGYGQQFDRESSIQSGFDHYFVKPADPTKLTAVLAGVKPG